MASTVLEIRADIKAIESDATLFEEMDFSGRAEALDSLEFELFERIESLRLTDGWSDALTTLKQRAKTLKRRLNGVDDGLFQMLREQIASGRLRGAELRQRMIECTSDG